MLIIGGGIAGLTAAHELKDRGFKDDHLTMKEKKHSEARPAASLFPTTCR